MCCGFRNFASTMASAMHLGEKLVSCFAVASVITCFVFTTVCMIALGIGIGYNYCIGELQAGEKKNPKALVRSYKRPMDINLERVNLTGLSNLDERLGVPKVNAYGDMLIEPVKLGNVMTTVPVRFAAPPPPPAPHRRSYNIEDSTLETETTQDFLADTSTFINFQTKAFRKKRNKSL